MRRTLTAVLLTLGVGGALLSGPKPRGEAQTAGTPFLSQTPRAMQFQPINTQQALGTINSQQMMYKPKSPTPLGLGNIFSKIPTFSFPPKFSSAPQIDPTKNPFQPNNPQGRYIINPTPPAPGSKTIWDFPYNPLKKTS
jgi:hypothetical protein